MMLFVVIATLLVSPFTAYLYSDIYLYAPGVYLHGLTAIIGIGYSGFLSIVINREDFGNSFRRFDSAAAVLTVSLLIAIILKSILFISIIIFLHMFFLLYLFKSRYGKHDAASLFVYAAIIIAFLAWVYFLYSMHFDKFFIFEVKFSYSLLALSFPLSLAIFSRLYPLFAGMGQLKTVLTVLVGGVLLMFAGMVIKSPLVGVFFAAVLIFWIGYIIYEAASRKRFPLIAAFTGLLITGISGVVYLIGSLYDANKATLFLHAHAAYLLWAVCAYYIIFLRIKTLDKITVFAFLVPMFLSFVLLSIYFVIFSNIWIFNLSAVLFFMAAAGFSLRVFCYRRVYERKEV